MGTYSMSSLAKVKLRQVLEDHENYVVVHGADEVGIRTQRVRMLARIERIIDDDMPARSFMPGAGG